MLYSVEGVPTYLSEGLQTNRPSRCSKSSDVFIVRSTMRSITAPGSDCSQSTLSTCPDSLAL